MIGGGIHYGKNDTSAQEETARQGSRLPFENGNGRRTQGFKSQKSKGKKRVNRLIFQLQGRRDAVFCFIISGVHGISQEERRVQGMLQVR